MFVHMEKSVSSNLKREAISSETLKKLSWSYFKDPFKKYIPFWLTNADIRVFPISY